VFSESFRNAQCVVENDGLVTNATVVNGNLLVDALNEYVEYKYYARPTTQMTIMAWVYPTEIDLTNGCMVASDYKYAVGNDGWRLGGDYLNPTNMGFNVWNSGNNTSCSVSDFLSTYLNQWVHVCGVYSGGNYVYFYVNGIKVAEDVTSIPSSIGYQSSVYLRIGARSDDTSHRWRGNIKDVRIFNKVLSASEILNYATGNVYGSMNLPTINLPMEIRNHDSLNSLTLDISGNSYNGTISGATKNTTSGGYSFDGTNDIITTSKSVDYSNNFSFGGWIKCNGALGGVTDDYAFAFGCADWSGSAVRGCCTRISSNSLVNSYGNGTTGQNSTIISNYTNGYAGSWNHIISTYNTSTQNIKIYLNGQNIVNTTFSITTPETGGKYFQTGGSSYLNASSSYWYGTIKFVKYWEGTELTDLQVKDLFEKELRRLNDL
jgi:hypothetical protein